MFVRSVGATIGIILIGSVMGLPGIPGVCNTQVAGNDNSMECARGLWLLWIIGSPVLSLFVALTAYMYPIHGDRLRTLIKQQGKTQKVIPGTKAFKGADAPNLPSIYSVPAGTVTVVKAKKKDHVVGGKDLVL